MRAANARRNVFQIVAAVTLVLSVANVVRAQTPPTEPVLAEVPFATAIVTPPPVTRAWSTHPTLAMYVSFATLQGLDVASTYEAIQLGHSEGNVLMRGLVRKPAAFIGAKVALTTTAIWLSSRMAKRHPKATFVTMLLLNSFYVAVVVHNYRLAASAR